MCTVQSCRRCKGVCWTQVSSVMGRCYTVYCCALLQLELVSERGLAATCYDHVAGLAHAKFMELLGTVPDLLTGKKVMAAMVMRTSDDDVGRVVSLGTGTS